MPTGGDAGPRRISVRLALPLVLIALALGVAAVTSRLESYSSSLYPILPTRAYRPALARVPSSGAESGVVAGNVPLRLGLSRGETVGSVLADLGLEPGESAQIIAELARFANLRRLRPEDTYGVVFDDEARLSGFELTLAGKGRARVWRGEEGWRGEWEELRKRVETRVLAGRLEGALESSIRAAGGEASLAYLMADVFQWDLDFNRDLREGDAFELLYDRVYYDGSYNSLGAIQAVTYTNLGRTLEAYRFGDPAGYYDAEGRPLRKMFLRSPLRYSRVTSRFSHRRFHPILKRYRPHLGVDYGAPVGTPVRVTANGVVSFAGWDRGGGRTVKVRHPNDYVTAYLHLSRFASGLRPGRRVAQGETIGYVGSTGLSTAPHLDYRVQHRGRWMDPLSLKSMPADPVPASLMPEFLARRDRLRAGLRPDLPPESEADRVADRTAEQPAAVALR